MYRLIQEAWPSITFAPGTMGSTTGEGAVITSGLTNRYFRAFAKIGFHYFLTQFPQYSGHEPIFSDIRNFILENDSGVDRANDFIGGRQHPLLEGMLTPGARPDGWRAHVLCAEVRPGECLAHVQMFLTEDWPAPSYTIRLAKDPSIAEIQACGHLYLHFGPEVTSRFAGEACSMGVKRTDFPLQPLKPVIKSA